LTLLCKDKFNIVNFNNYIGIFIFQSCLSIVQPHLFKLEKGRQRKLPKD